MFEIIRNFRREGKILTVEGFDDEGNEILKPYFELGIGFHHGNLWLSATSGRLYSPAIILYKRKVFTFRGREYYNFYFKEISNKSWNELLSSGTIEYLDALEKISSPIAIYQRYLDYASAVDEIDRLLREFKELAETGNEADVETKQKIEVLSSQLERFYIQHNYSHLVIEPNEIFGIAGSTIPMPERIRGPRIAYQCKMLNQAINQYPPTTVRKAFFPKVRTLIYSGTPLVRTAGERRVNLDEFGNGTNLLVLFASFEGNQEDSSVWNASSLDKLSAFIYETLERAQGDDGHYHVRFYKPFPKAGERDDLYDRLDRNGWPEIGAYFDEFEMVIGMIRYPKLENTKYAQLLSERESLFDLEDEIAVMEGKAFESLSKTIRKKSKEIPSLKEINETYFAKIRLLKIYYASKGEEYKEKLRTYDLLLKILLEAEKLKSIDLSDVDLSNFDKVLLPIWKEKYQAKLNKLRSSELQAEGNLRGVSAFTSRGQKVFINNVLVFDDETGNRAVKVSIRQRRQVGIGHKQNPRAGQKSTIGQIINRRDMPFTETGMVPDVILNPFALINRMTISWVIEMLTGKIDALFGTQSEINAYRPFDQGEVIRKLTDYGFSTAGTEVFYSGLTGKKFKGELFVGPSYITQLKHMAEDKFFSRGTLGGAYSAGTGQPVKGRVSRTAQALRWGSMDTDSVLAHGASRVVRERLVLSGGTNRIIFCSNCGRFASFSPDNNVFLCKSCGSSQKFVKTQLPSTFKYITHQMAAANSMLTVRFSKGPQIEEETSEDEGETSEGEASEAEPEFEMSEGEGFDFDIDDIGFDEAE